MINKFGKYMVISELPSLDYLAKDRFDNRYVLAKYGSHQPVKLESYNNAIIEPYDEIKIEDGQRYAVYFISERNQWIGSINILKWKSEFFCLTVLYGIVNQVCPLLIQYGLKALQFVECENIWLKDNTLSFLLHPRQQQNYLINNLNNEISQKDLQALYLYKIAKVMKPIFKISNDHKTFLSILINSMLHQQLTFQKFNNIMNNKRERRRFMQQYKNTENTITPTSGLTQQIWNKKQLQTNRNRRSLKNTHNKKMTGDIDQNLTENRNRIYIPPSFARKRNSFNIFQQSYSVSKSKSKHRHYFKAEKSDSKRDRSKNRYDELGASTESYYKETSRRGESVQIESIMKTIKERALKKFEQNRNTIDIADLEMNQHQSHELHRLSLDKDKIVRNLFGSRTQTIQYSSEYRPSHEEHHNKFIISKKPSGLLRKGEQIKKQLLATINLDHQTHSQEKPYFHAANNYHSKDNLHGDLNLSPDTRTHSPTRYDQQKIQKMKEQQKQKLDKQKLIAETEELLRKQYAQKERLRKIEQEAKKQLELKQNIERERREIEKKREQQMLQLKQLREEKQRLIEQEIRRKKQQEIQEEIKRRKLQEEEQKKKEKQLQEQMKKKQQELARIKLEKQKIEKENEERMKKLNEKKQGNGKLDVSEAVPTSQASSARSKIDLNKVEEVPEISEDVKMVDKKQFDKNKKPPLPKKSIKQQDYEEQIEEITLVPKSIADQSKFHKKETKKQSLQKKATTEKTQPKENNRMKSTEKSQEKEIPSHKRVNTGQSSVASSYGPKKPVQKQVAEYMHLINKMGEAVAKSSKISNKLGDIEWFTGVYFIYKRFLFERKKIEKWLKNNQHKLTRYIGDADDSQWNKWFSSTEKDTLLERTEKQNQSIVNSIIKMNKKIMKKNLPGNFLYHASLNQQSPEQSKIIVSEVVKEFDSIEEKNLLSDPEIFTHISDLMNSISILAELDGKIKEKKPLVEILKKKTQEDIEQIADEIYDLYLPEE